MSIRNLPQEREPFSQPITVCRERDVRNKTPARDFEPVTSIRNEVEFTYRFLLYSPEGELIADDGALAVIPSKSNAREPIPHDAGLYKMRNIVERFFCTIMKDMRRLATRFEKLSRNFLAMIHIFAIRLWIN